MKERNNLPVLAKNFKYLANLVIQELEQLLATNNGKVTYQDYIWALAKYMIPFFGKYQFADITQDLLKQFDDWRVIKMRRRPSGSHLNIHNAAMNRVFNKAVVLRYANREQFPKLKNTGVKAGRRPEKRTEMKQH